MHYPYGHRRGKTFHLEQLERMTLPQLKIMLEKEAWELKRFLDSPDLYRQNFHLTLTRMSKQLIRTQAIYQRARMERVLL